MVSDTELGELADKIVSRLNGSVISSAFPASIGRYIRESIYGSQWQASFWIPLRGPAGIQATWYFEIDGAVRLELGEPSGAIFWRGTFRPEETADAHA